MKNGIVKSITKSVISMVGAYAGSKVACWAFDLLSGSRRR